MTVPKLFVERKEAEKKEDVKPLVNAAEKVDNDVESAAVRVVRQKAASKSVCIWILALFVTAVGVLSGVYLYRELMSRQSRRFHGWCRVPTDVDSKQRIMLINDALIAPSLENELKMMNIVGDGSNEDSSSSDEMINQVLNTLDRSLDRSLDQQLAELERQFFDQQVDIEDDESVKIEVPQFGFHRQGRFYHDFRANFTGIMDVDAGRCFVAPLDPNVIMPPKNLMDLMFRTATGYYERVMDVIRTTMRVVTPALEDTQNLGNLINKQCNGLPIYRLESITNPIYKRSIDHHGEGHFVEYAGMGIIEFNIINLEDAVGNKV